MGVISQNGIDYPVPSVPVQSDGSATDLTNAAVPTGQTIKSYLNSNLYPKIYETSIVYGGTLTFTKRSGHMMRVTGCRKNLGFCLMCPAADNENPIIIYNSGILSSASVQGTTLSITVGASGYGSFVNLLVETF